LISKYNNKKVEYEGIKFDSKMERDYYKYLLENRYKMGIRKIELQVPFILQEKYIHNNKTVRAIKYVTDFKITYTCGDIKYIDVKGKETDIFKLKKKMLLHKYKDIDFRCVKKVKGEWVYF
jgi:sporulation protein YlmC with PRC-barrel domain